VESPCKNSEEASIPLFEFDVILLLKITGPSNCEISVESVPPSTRIERETEISRGVSASNHTLTPVRTSSPVTVGTGESNTCSCPVAELTFLFPT